MAQFAAFVLSPHTAQVDAAIDYHRQRLAFDTEGTLLGGIELEDAVRQAAADYAGGAPGDYALTDSTTMGIALMYGGLSLQPGDEVLTTSHDFYSTEDSLRLLEQRTGATVRRVTLYDNPWQATVDQMTTRLLAGAQRTHQGRRDDLGALLDRCPDPGPGDRPGAAGARAGHRPAGAAVRRRRARLRCRRRRPARPRLRLPVRRHPQVAVRSARDGHLVGPQLRPARPS